MHDDKPDMYDDLTDMYDDMTEMCEYHIHVWYHIPWVIYKLFFIALTRVDASAALFFLFEFQLKYII